MSAKLAFWRFATGWWRQASVPVAASVVGAALDATSCGLRIPKKPAALARGGSNVFRHLAVGGGPAGAFCAGALAYSKQPEALRPPAIRVVCCRGHERPCAYLGSSPRHLGVGGHRARLEIVYDKPASPAPWACGPSLAERVLRPRGSRRSGDAGEGDIHSRQPVEAMA